nr:transposase [Paraburkholderia pallida]
MKGRCRQRSRNRVIFNGETATCLYGETTVLAHVPHHPRPALQTQRQTRKAVACTRARGHLNVTLKVEKTPMPATGMGVKSVGLDLGLKDFAGTSDGHVITLERHYRNLEKEVAKAQRARKRARVRALHAKIKNSRKDQLHKLSTVLVQEYGAIFVGNVNASALARTRMAKSMLDAGWSLFRTMLQYKCDDAGVWFDEVDEAYSTQTCSCCNRRTGPRGLEGLGIREWACFECGAYHHRDINAADNILAAGRRRLAVGIPVLPAPCAAAAG